MGELPMVQTDVDLRENPSNLDFMDSADQKQIKSMESYQPGSDLRT